MGKMKSCIILSLGLFVNVVHSYNILFMLSYGTRSHKNVFDPVAEELGRRGHQVVLFSPVEEKVDPPGVRNVFWGEFDGIVERVNFSLFVGTATSVTMLTTFLELSKEITETTFKDPFITDIIKEPLDPLTKNPKYDVVVVDAALNDFSMALGHHMSVPNILFSPMTAFHYHAWNLNVPYPISYIPSFLSDVQEPMGFCDRVMSTFSILLFSYFMNNHVFPIGDVIIKKYLPNSPPLVELNRNVSFMLSNSHPAVYLRKPNMPYTVEVGGVNCHPAKPLSKDLERFIQQAGKFGVIYFSLGSLTKGETMPLEMREKFIEVFAKLPQKIIWKYEKDISNLPNNIKLLKWIPQQDILGHPQTRLFITHGGGLSYHEAIYHGCPILGFPISGDQLGNMVHAKRLGFGEYLNYRTFTSEKLLEVIRKLLDDKSYKEKAMLASVLLKDRLQNPVETAAYWIEYVVRHNGAPFLKPSADHLNFFQYFLLDIIAAAITILVVFLIILFLVGKYSFRLLFILFKKPSQLMIAKRKRKLN